MGPTVSSAGGQEYILGISIQMHSSSAMNLSLPRVASGLRDY
jgi:hypothetical protein